MPAPEASPQPATSAVCRRGPAVDTAAGPRKDPARGRRCRRWPKDTRVRWWFVGAERAHREQCDGDSSMSRFATRRSGPASGEGLPCAWRMRAGPTQENSAVFLLAAGFGAGLSGIDGVVRRRFADVAAGAALTRTGGGFFVVVVDVFFARVIITRSHDSIATPTSGPQTLTSSGRARYSLARKVGTCFAK